MLLFLLPYSINTSTNLFLLLLHFREGDKYTDFVDALNSVVKVIEKEPAKAKEPDPATVKPQL